MNNKNIIIIGSHPNHPSKMDMLRDCIDRVKPLGYDILLVSHYPLPSDIQESVDYVIYDKENVKMFNTNPIYWWGVEGVNVRKYNSGIPVGHALAVVKNINNGINYVNYLNYEFFFYMECDNLLAPDDLFKIELLKNSMFLKRKKMVLFNPESDERIYETLMFGGIPNHYCENIHLPTIEEDFKGYKISLERFFYKTHHDKESSYHVVNSSSQEYFSNSEINKDFSKYMVEVFGSNEDPYLYLFIYNFPENPNKIVITINDKSPREFCSGCWHLDKVHLGTPLVAKILSDGIETVREFSLTEEDKLGYFKNGFISFG